MTLMTELSNGPVKLFITE